MTSCKKVARLACAILLLSLPLFGQYTAGSYLNGQADNSSYCVNTNCWNDITATKTLTGMTVAPDGTLLGVDSSHDLYQYDYATAHWVEVSSNLNGSIALVYAGSATEILALSTATSGGNVYLSTNGGSTFTQLGTQQCGYSGAITSDGFIYCIDNSLNVYDYWGAPPTWHSAGSGFTSIAATTGNIIVAIETTGAAMLYNPTTGWGTLSLPFTPKTDAPGAVGIGPDMSLAFIDNTSTGNLWTTNTLGSAWWEPTGWTGSSGLIRVAVGGAELVMGLGSAGHTKHWNSQMPMATTNISGQVNCPSCSNSTIHTATSTVTLPHHINSGTGTLGQAASQPFNFNVADENIYCDPFTFANGECNWSWTADVTCPIAGELLGSSGVVTVADNLASEYEQKYKITGEPAAWVHLPYIGWGAIGVPVEQWCSNSPIWPTLTTVFLEWWTTSSTQPTLPEYLWVTIETEYNGSFALGSWVPTTNAAVATTCTGLPYGVAKLAKPQLGPSDEEMLALAFHVK
jgi:hypothetical protein